MSVAWAPAGRGRWGWGGVCLVCLLGAAMVSVREGHTCRPGHTTQAEEAWIQRQHSAIAKPPTCLPELGGRLLHQRLPVQAAGGPQDRVLVLCVAVLQSVRGGKGGGGAGWQVHGGGWMMSVLLASRGLLRRRGAGKPWPEGAPQPAPHTQHPTSNAKQTGWLAGRLTLMSRDCLTEVWLSGSLGSCSACNHSRRSTAGTAGTAGQGPAPMRLAA